MIKRFVRIVNQAIYAWREMRQRQILRAYIRRQGFSEAFCDDASSAE